MDLVAPHVDLFFENFLDSLNPLKRIRGFLSTYAYKFVYHSKIIYGERSIQDGNAYFALHFRLGVTAREARLIVLNRKF